MVRRFFTDNGFDSGDTLKLAQLDLLGIARRANYSSVVSQSRASFAANNLLNYINKEFFIRNSDKNNQ